MKSKKRLQKTKLTKKQIKRGIFINAIQRVKEIPYRKLHLDDFVEVALTRKAMYLTDHGKRLAVVLPVPEN